MNDCTIPESSKPPVVDEVLDITLLFKFEIVDEFGTYIILYLNAEAACNLAAEISSRTKLHNCDANADVVAPSDR